MNKIILSVFLVLCIAALSYSSPVEEPSVGVAVHGKPSALSLTPEESLLPLEAESEGHDADQQREKRQFFGGYGGYGRRRWGGYGRRWGGYGGYGRGYGGYGFYG